MKETKNARPVGMGTGYLSLMMIFVMLCLTVLAALSLSAAENGRRFSERSAEYTRQYYAADLEAQRKLSEVDGVMRRYTDFGDFMLLSELDGIEGIEYTGVKDGMEVSWLTPINGSQSISMRVRFTRGGYEILSGRTVSSAEASAGHLDVWQGE